ncbi:GTPase domain-containing protein [Pinirhizobacter sp.]|jgi:signal recognition particle receptor subunit beta|uniref:GTPase domain-containing protein n=1 Tax=Pinirhizobacter sp. TaxID=2950432 RepID=UPI002F3E33B2
MDKQWWADYRKGITASTNSTGGIVGLVSLGITAASAVISIPIVTIGGTVFLCASIVYVLSTGLPEKKRDASDCCGEKLALSDLDRIKLPVTRVALMGASRVGKTTLMDNLNAKVPDGSRTDSPYAMIVQLPGASKKYIAILDAAGQQFSQQFQITDSANALLIFVDHADSNTESMKPERLIEHSQFLEQLRRHIVNKGLRSLRVHILFNKKDLWNSGPDAVDLQSWFSEQIKLWDNLTNKPVTASIFSNWNTLDQTLLTNTISGW